MLKIILLNLFSISNSYITAFDRFEIVDISGFDIQNINKKIKNLLKAKNIEKLTRFNKPHFSKVKNTIRLVFFTA